jgi:hypothetical protein
MKYTLVSRYILALSVSDVDNNTIEYNPSMLRNALYRMNVNIISPLRDMLIADTVMPMIGRPIRSNVVALLDILTDFHNVGLFMLCDLIDSDITHVILIDNFITCLINVT